MKANNDREVEPTEGTSAPPSFWAFRPRPWAIVVGVAIGVILVIALFEVLESVEFCPCQTPGVSPAVELGGLQTGTNANGNHWLNLSMIAVTNGLTTKDLGWKIVDPNGSAVNGWAVTVRVGTRAIATFQAGAPSWSSDVPVNTSEVMAFYTGSQNLVGSNDSIIAFGLDGESVSGEYGPL